MDGHEHRSNVPPASTFGGFADLAANRTEGVDFTVTVVKRAGSNAAVIAPHGGRIEPVTSDVARLIAGDDLNLYLLEGCMPGGNYAALHLTSSLFDEPRCLSLQSECDRTVAIHGCSGNEVSVLVGGLDEALKAALVTAIAKAGIQCSIDNGKFAARQPANICNRNRRGMGAQLEMSLGLRRTKKDWEAVAAAVREVLSSPGPSAGNDIG